MKPTARFILSALGLVLALLVGGLRTAPLAHIAQAAFTQSNHVAFTLEGCRNNGTITLPNGSGQFICPDSAYTTGNLGKGWNELDLVPHRLTTTAGSQSGTTTDYDVYIAADYQTSGRIGYDVISVPVVNPAKSDSSCTVSAGSQSTQGSTSSPFGGGTDVVIYRDLTIHQSKNTTCVFDWYQRLALGAHLYPGSSLQSYMFEATDFSTGKRTVSIPVKEIAPQSINKDMTATQGSDHVWNIVKSPTPATLTFSNTCDTSQPTSQGVAITVSWTKQPATPSGSITVVTHVYATNPASRVITVNVSDDIRSGTSELDTATSGNVDVSANTASFLILTHTTTVPSGTTNLNDIATATYTDKVTGIAVPGNTTATASAPVQLSGPELDQTATITDVERIVGAGLTFSADSFAPSSAGSFDAGYTGGKTTGPVGWTSVSQNVSGSVTFTKTVYVDQGTSTSGTLTDTARLTGSDGFTAQDSASVGISASALVSLTISKTVSPDPATGAQTFTFHVKDHTGSVAATPSITFQAGDTGTKSVTVNNLAPDTYTVSEGALTGWVSQPDQSAPINLPTCSGAVSFANVQQGRIIVKKVTDPSTDTTTPFTFKASYTSTAFSLTNGGSNDSGFLNPGSYSVSENATAGWDQTGATCDNGDNPSSITLNPGLTLTCTFTNTKRGTAQVVKTVSGVTPPSTSTLSFEFQLRQNASPTYSSSQPDGNGTILEDRFANAADNWTISFTTLLVPGTTYQLCEANLMPGWMTSLTGSFVPNSVGNPNPINTVLCVNFTVTPGETHTFNVDNRPPPGGRALTIGFWKNWASCANSKGKQQPVLDQTLAKAEPTGIVVSATSGVYPGFGPTFYLVLHGSTTNSNAAPDCSKAVNLLNKTTIDGTKKMASDPAFNLAAQLVAAELNYTAGAAQTATAAINQAVLLLGKYQFNGLTHTMISSADAMTMNSLATTLDNYNNDR